MQLRWILDTSILLFLLIFALLFALRPAFAVPTLQNLNKETTEKVTNDFGATFVHTSLSQASGRKGFAIEVGAKANVTQSPAINDVAQENVGLLPNAGLVGILYLPGGLGAEYVYLPEQKYQGLSIQNNSVAARWTISELFAPNGFIAFRIRGFYGDARIDYSQRISDVPVEVGFRGLHHGGDVAISLQNIPYVEPYGTFGFVNLDSRLRGTGTAKIFDQSYTQSEQVKIDQQQSIKSVGLIVRVPFVLAAFETSWVGANQRYGLKIALHAGASDAKSTR